MSIIEPERPDGAAGDESDALVEFLGRQDLSSRRKLSSEQELQEYIRSHNDLLFIRPEKAVDEPVPRQTAELADPAWSVEPWRGARTRTNPHLRQRKRADPSRG